MTVDRVRHFAHHPSAHALLKHVKHFMFAPTANDIIQDPSFLGFLWGAVLGLSMGMFCAVILVHLQRPLCYCGKRHPARPQGMSTLDFMKYFCGRYTPHGKESGCTQ